MKNYPAIICMEKKLVLIDGHSILYRAFYGLPDLTTSQGDHTNAILGFINIFLKILEEEDPELLVIAFDTSHPTFRHDMFAEYKGTRKPMPGELREQVPKIKELLKAMNIMVVEKPGYEADDVLGTLAVQAEGKGMIVSLVSGDRDLLQLASNKIKIRIPKTKKGGTEIEDYYADDVLERYEVTPKEFIDLKGLMGDSSDNIPGVPGIGEKTGIKLIKAYNSIENVYQHIDELKGKMAINLKENKDKAFLSKELATICTDCELDIKLEDATLGDIYNEEVYQWFKKLEFKNLLSRFQTEYQTDDEDYGSTEIEKVFLLVTDLKKAEDIFNNSKKTKEVVGFQVIAEEGKIFALSICYNEENIYHIQCSDEISAQYLMEQVSELAKEGHRLSTFALKAQLPHLELGEKDNIFDLAIAAYLLNPLTDTYNYDDIARDYLAMTLPSRKGLLDKATISQAVLDNKDDLLSYSCYKAYVAHKAAEPLKNQLIEGDLLQLFEDVEMPLVYLLYEMETRGIRVNKEALKEYGDKLQISINELQEEIYKMADEEFNINSPKQLGIILFEKLKLPFAKKTKTGYSTAADVLEKLQSQHPIASKVLEYRQLTKLKSTYADGLAVFIMDDGRIHGKFNQTITATGRISSTDPNLQNIPIRMELGRQIRKVFIPKDDYIFLDADYSQIELRVLAHLSEDDKLINAYKEGKDIHQITASEVFHTPFEEVTSAQRSSAKAVNFGIVYGISSYGLGQDLNITRKEADHYIERYFETYPKIKEYLDGLVEESKEKGYSETIFGRRRPIPELTSSNYMRRSFGERVAMNAPIQGTAADIIKIAMIRVNRRLKDNNMQSQLLLQVHDELLIETHKEEVDEVRKILQEEMEGAAQLHVPLLVDISQGENWYEA